MCARTLAYCPSRCSRCTMRFSPSGLRDVCFGGERGTTRSVGLDVRRACVFCRVFVCTCWLSWGFDHFCGGPFFGWMDFLGFCTYVCGGQSSMAQNVFVNESFARVIRAETDMTQDTGWREDNPCHPIWPANKGADTLRHPKHQNTITFIAQYFELKAVRQRGSHPSILIISSPSPVKCGSKEGGVSEYLPHPRSYPRDVGRRVRALRGMRSRRDFRVCGARSKGSQLGRYATEEMGGPPSSARRKIGRGNISWRENMQGRGVVDFFFSYLVVVLVFIFVIFLHLYIIIIFFVIIILLLLIIFLHFVVIYFVVLLVIVIILLATLASTAAGGGEGYAFALAFTG